MHCQNNILDCYQLSTKYISIEPLDSNLTLAKYCFFFVCCYFTLCMYLACIEFQNGLKYEKKCNVVFTKKNCNYVFFFCRHLMTIVY